MECLGENIAFSVPIKKGLDNRKRIPCKLKFIDSFRCQANYQTLLIIYLEFTAKKVEGVKKEIESNQYAILKTKMINYTTNTTNAKKDCSQLSAG